MLLLFHLSCSILLTHTHTHTHLLPFAPHTNCLLFFLTHSLSLIHSLTSNPSPTISISIFLSLTRAEKDALDNVRRSVESELDRTRIELSSLRLLSRDTEENEKAGYEVEKLLGALKSTIDHMSSSISGTNSVTRKYCCVHDFFCFSLCIDYLIILFNNSISHRHWYSLHHTIFKSQYSGIWF